MKYKHLSVKKVELSAFAPEVKARHLSPRQQAQRERDDELRAAFNEAAALPASEAVAIQMKPDQKVATLRAAITKLMKSEPRDLKWGVRGKTILITKGEIPSRRR